MCIGRPNNAISQSVPASTIVSIYQYVVEFFCRLVSPCIDVD